MLSTLLASRMRFVISRWPSFSPCTSWRFVGFGYSRIANFQQLLPPPSPSLPPSPLNNHGTSPTGSVHPQHRRAHRGQPISRVAPEGRSCATSTAQKARDGPISNPPFHCTFYATFPTFAAIVNSTPRAHPRPHAPCQGIAVGNGCWGGDAHSVECNGPNADRDKVCPLVRQCCHIGLITTGDMGEGTMCGLGLLPRDAVANVSV